MTDLALSEFDAACLAIEGAREDIIERAAEIRDTKDRRVRELIDELLDAVESSPDLPWEVQRTIEALAFEVGILTPDWIRRR